MFEVADALKLAPDIVTEVPALPDAGPKLAMAGRFSGGGGRFSGVWFW